MFWSQIFRRPSLLLFLYDPKKRGMGSGGCSKTDTDGNWFVSVSHRLSFLLGTMDEKETIVSSCLSFLVTEALFMWVLVVYVTYVVPSSSIHEI